jgi:hypothetical protein
MIITSLHSNIPGVISAMTATRHVTTTIENVLNGQVDVVALSKTSNLDTIRETAQRSMSPATTAILRNVLIERMRQERYAVDITPRK